MKGYLVIGGKVISKSDGQEHYIPPHRLCELYGLNPKAPNVILIEDDNSDRMRGMRIGYARKIGWIILRPRYDGNYGLNEEGRPF